MNPEETWVERRLREALEAGAFTGLPGEGRPLRFDDDPYTPDAWKLAYRILKDNNLAPEWIEQGKHLDAWRERLLDRISRAIRDRQAVRARGGSPERAELAWQVVNKALSREVERYNRELLSYNVKVPAGFPQKLYLDLTREIERLSQQRINS